MTEAKGRRHLRLAEGVLEIARGWTDNEQDRHRARAFARLALHHVRKWAVIVRGQPAERPMDRACLV